MPKPIYVPPPGLRTRMDDFRDYVNKAYSLKLKDYHQLHEFSVTRPNDFWMSVWNYTGIRASVKPCRALENDDQKIYPPPSFFAEARLNFAENLLCGKDEAIAVIEMNETNIHNPTRYTWKALRQLVARYAGVLEREGLKQGDVVVRECQGRCHGI